MKTRELLDQLYREINTVILSRQNPVTGLLPASISITSHGDYTDAWVRDNVYSVVCVWALGLAYRRHKNTERADEMTQATVKLMRGLLDAMMRQAPKVERFKHTLKPLDSLHAKYETTTALPVVADDAWGHLQIDATSLFLLMLAQISASGVRVIFTHSEVDFIQNLIYYVASAYRTPDFGIWERGNKINNGNPEINASSVGMAKAALQALDGFNLFGKNASSRAVVHTVADSISLARSTLASLLPRESMSKEVDSALLSIIGFPAFAVGDDALVTKTRDKILSTLGGEYGCKRFIWDGHQTVLEDTSRLYYEHTELANFEHVESEWPLFFCFLYCDALFKENQATAQHYRKKIESLMIYRDGIGLIPELYFLPQENIAAEKKQPKSQARVPNDNTPLVWAQSLYYTGLMIDEDLLEPDDLDPCKLRSRNRRFNQTQVALVVLAENEEIKEECIRHGVIAETLSDIRPISVISAPHLMEAYHHVGENDALGLSGRPLRRLQSLSTSQTYDINHRQFLCLSWIQGSADDYRSYDAKRIAFKLEQEMSHIQSHWLNHEVAVFTFMVDRRTSGAVDKETLYRSLRQLQLKIKNDRVGYASAKLAIRASRMNHLSIPRVCITPLDEYRARDEESVFQDLPPLHSAFEKLKSVLERDIALLELDETVYQECVKLKLNYTLDSNIAQSGIFTFSSFVDRLYRFASKRNAWLTSRWCYAVLEKNQGLLADSIILLTARHLSVVLGNKRSTYYDVSAYRSDQEILAVIAKVSSNPLERSLLQEIISILGSLVRTNTHLFEGLRSIYVNNLLGLLHYSEDLETPALDGDKGLDASGHDRYLENLHVLARTAPAEILFRLLEVLKSQRSTFTQDFDLNALLHDEQINLVSGVEEAHAVDTDWLEWRTMRGLVFRLDEEFLAAFWAALSHTPLIIFGDGASEDCSMKTDEIRRSMTPGEESFARSLDHYLSQVHPAYFKCAVIEVLYAFTQFCRENPEAEFKKAFDPGLVLERAAENFVKERPDLPTQTRNMDMFLENSPLVLNRYIGEVLKTIAEIKE